MNAAPGAVFKTLHFLRGLQMGQLSWNICPCLVNCNTLAYWAQMQFMQEKSIVNMAPGAVFRTLRFLHGLGLSQLS